MEIWDKLDEIIGAGFLTAIATYSLHLEHVEITGVCAAGIISLLAAKAGKNGAKEEK